MFKYLKRYLDEAEYAGVLRHSHIIRRVKLEFFLILRDVIALTLVAPTFSATLYATYYASSELTFREFSRLLIIFLDELNLPMSVKMMLK